ncbi:MULTISPECIES: gamma-type small acid-soluble spore protein [Sporosarcina]|uniref:Small, acid-soluble spore protein gamma-type n=1 Tax=Sporosarcina saromensis TaxID=359365 RepID=A0ABU4GC92_9BACL|nr:gamma-type small acid-soluble spore protein [Sporosarcina saromensis]MDW0114600.1 gamma-type small acid-soluble spore protein [Sporosarcina saromensis]
MTKKNRNQNQTQNQGQFNQQNMQEEFGMETDVNHVKQQNMKAEQNKRNASGARANSYEDQSK